LLPYAQGMNMSRRIALVDGNAIAFRSLFTHEFLTTKINKKNIYTGLPFGFVKTLISIYKDYSPKKFVIFWDGGAHRKKEIYPEYKSGRKLDTKKMKFSDVKRSLKITRNICKLIGLEQNRIIGEESDDCIATYINNFPKEKFFIISNDHDFFQLLSKNVKLLRMKHGETKVWDRKLFEKEKGFKPKYYAHYLAIVGDSTDKIPGIKGLGPASIDPIFKSNEKPTLDYIYANLEDFEVSDKIKNKISSGKENAYKFLSITSLKKDIILNLKQIEQKPKELYDLLTELQFKSIYDNDKNLELLCGLK